MRWEVVTHSSHFEKTVPFQKNEDMAFGMLDLLQMLMLIASESFMVIFGFHEIT